MKSKNAIPTPHFDEIDPRQCVNAKLRKLHRLVNNAYMSKFKPFGLGGSMVSILFIIGKRPGVNQKTIADALILDASTMSRDLKKLTTKGWIEAKKGEDSRQTQLYLTKDGCRLLEEISPIWQELHSNITALLGGFSIQQIDTITAAIRDHEEQLTD